MSFLSIEQELLEYVVRHLTGVTDVVGQQFKVVESLYKIPDDPEILNKVYLKHFCSKNGMVTANKLCQVKCRLNFTEYVLVVTYCPYDKCAYYIIKEKEAIDIRGIYKNWVAQNPSNASITFDAFSCNYFSSAFAMYRAEELEVLEIESATDFSVFEQLKKLNRGVRNTDSFEDLIME